MGDKKNLYLKCVVPRKETAFVLSVKQVRKQALASIIYLHRKESVTIFCWERRRKCKDRDNLLWIKINKA